MTHSINTTTAMSQVDHLESFRCLKDKRGSLCVAQSNLLHQKFDIKRVFWIYGVPEGAIRGEHANRSCTELLVAVSGSVKVWLTDGNSECEFVLDTPEKGLYIPPMVWCRLTAFSADCVCLCMANQDYDERLYINQYEDFIKETTR